LLYNPTLIRNKSIEGIHNKNNGTLSSDKYFKLQNHNDFGDRRYVNLSSKKNMLNNKTKYVFNTFKL